MKAELNAKKTRTVYGEKVVRLVLDIPYEQVEEAEGEGEDMLAWLDNNVDSDVLFEVGPFEDDMQERLSKEGELVDREGEVR